MCSLSLSLEVDKYTRWKILPHRYRSEESEWKWSIVDCNIYWWRTTRSGSPMCVVLNRSHIMHINHFITLTSLSLVNLYAFSLVTNNKEVGLVIQKHDLTTVPWFIPFLKMRSIKLVGNTLTREFLRNRCDSCCLTSKEH